MSIVFSDDNGKMIASHLSIDIIDDNSLNGKIIGHLASDDPHSELLPTSKETLIIFQSDSLCISLS